LINFKGFAVSYESQAKTKMGSSVRFWERFRADFLSFKLPDWVTLYQAICLLPVVELPVFDTS
jgi:hypothetical protein